MAFVEASRDRDGAAPSAVGRIGARIGLVGLFSGTLLLAALLLFSMQPMFTKRVLPILGGSPAVWSVAMVVFQALLLAGYAYAHALTRWLQPRAALALHVLVLLAGFLFLPVAVARGFGAPPAEGEALWLIGLFLASVGLPFFALSASAPLLQAWFARSGDARSADPYFLYRASNAGSFAALIAYPLAVEPLLGLDAQARLWSIGYGALTCAVVACGLRLRNGAPVAGPAAAAAEASPTAGRRLAWIGLSAVPSGLLVAATAHISTDVAAIPLIWVVPLALYLASFIVAFRPGPTWAGRWLGGVQVVGTLVAFAALLFKQTPFLIDLGVTLGLLLVNALIAHRAVYTLRPPAARLTEFYLCTSLGGVVGGIFAALVAPQIFSDVSEYPLLLAAALLCRPGVIAGGLSAMAREAGRCAMLLGGAILAALIATLLRGPQVGVGVLLVCLMLTLAAGWRVPARAALVGIAVGIGCVLLQAAVWAEGGNHRSFFGVHRVYASPDGQFRLLTHGTTIHGAMRLRAADGTPSLGRPEPATYYAPGAPLADVLAISREINGPIPAVSVVGLGAGSLACHAQAGEAWTFYEIDPVVIRLAQDATTFRFLSDCAPDARIVQGDARLTLSGRTGQARVLVIDAFSSDAIPVHLLTREALAVDLAHLDAQGLLALHISNRHFDLSHVLARLAAERGLTLLRRLDMPKALSARSMRLPSEVVLMTRDPGTIRAAEAFGWTVVAADLARRPWSDDFANALEALHDRWQAPLPAMP
ncbi:fused MFS/spermidine synthase [Methylobacterium sp. Leaf118]|uniref:fused MFS/spermidine synthase n=1 Tax=Methylobacterium sp. Leaf118 TaxID=2876562 RepID=UPI001E38A893|nr:fused MFS/spermidine synthase [Methylobacterium sp. Leaf118]